MKTLILYIGNSILQATAAAVGVLFFVMVAGHLVQVLFFTAKGISPALVFKYLMYMTPDILTYILPIAMLCATILVFSRMSADNEVTAMKANGISLWQIVSPAIVLSILFSAFCLYLHAYVRPVWNYKAFMIQRTVGLANPAVLLETGRHIEIPVSRDRTYLFYAGDRRGDVLQNIHLQVLNRRGQAEQALSAKTGSIVSNPEQYSSTLHLEGVAITQLPGADPDAAAVFRVRGESMDFPIDYGEEIQRQPLLLRTKYLTMAGLISRIALFEGRKGTDEDSPEEYRIEIHKRLALALSPLAFVFLAIPFGIQSRRSELSLNIIIAFLLAGSFYIFLVFADALREHRVVPPELVIWAPALLYQIGGLWMLRKVEMR